MEFIDLKEQYRRLKDKIDANIQEVLNDSDYIMGKEVKRVRSTACRICRKKILCYLWKWNRCFNNCNESIRRKTK